MGEIPTMFRKKYVKPQQMVIAKHKFQRLVFNPMNQKLADFLDELQKLAKDAFGVATQAIIEQYIYAKKTLHLKNAINQAHLENTTYEKIVAHFERELELNGLEAPVELQINTVTQQAIQQNSEKPKPTYEKPGHYQNQCRQLKREKDQAQENTNIARTNNNNNSSGQTNSNSNIEIPHKTNAKTLKTKLTENLDLSTHSVRPVVKLTIPHRTVTWEQT